MGFLELWRAGAILHHSVWTYFFFFFFSVTALFYLEDSRRERESERERKSARTRDTVCGLIAVGSLVVEHRL